MLFNDFVHKYNFEKKQHQTKTQQVLSIGLDNVDIYSKDVPFSCDIGFVNLHLFQGTQWVLYFNENFFDSYGCAPPRKLSKFIIKRNGYCFSSEYKIQGLTNKQDSYCSKYCFHIIYLTKVLGIDFKSAVSNL